MESTAVLMNGPKRVELAALALTPPGARDVVVEVAWSGISTGTEKLFWSGEMPSFPGMGYPLVPGYEAMGEVVEAGPGATHRVGDTVFVPGASCYHDARGLFGGASRRLVSAADRAVRIDPAIGPDGALLALAATARHAIIGPARTAPDLIVGHGVLGRLLARLTLAVGAPPPTVWEVDPIRRDGVHDYSVLHPDDDPRSDYRAIYDASGDPALLDGLIGRLQRGGEVVLAGFYPRDLCFAFPPAFMKEARLRVSAEWTPEDLVATRDLVERGDLSLAGLITHERPAAEASDAYGTAFGDPACLKMILDWSAIT